MGKTRARQRNHEYLDLLFDFEGSQDSEKKTPGGVAQLGEHLPCKQGVMGSNPIISTKGTRRMTKDELTTEKWAHSSGG